MKCACCGSTCELTRDHVIPKAFGYDLNRNKQILCRKCNENKGILVIDYNKKIAELQPYMFSLNQKGLNFLFEKPKQFGAVLFSKPQLETFKKKYVKTEILALRQAA